MKIIITMSKLFFAMFIGGYANRKGILTKEINKKISTFIMDISLPLLIICSAASTGGKEKEAVLFLTIAGIILYLILPFLSKALIKILQCPQDKEAVYRCMIMFSNSAFMGYPVVEALYGSKAILYATVFHIGFDVLFYSYGVYLIAKEAGEITKFEVRQVVNPGSIAGVTALVMCFLGIRLPEILTEPMSFIGNITMPLSMIIVGANMGNYAIKELFSDRKIYGIAILRLLVMPILTASVLRLFTSDFEIIAVSAMTMGMPVAAMVAMSSGMYESEGKTGAVGVAFTTICSMVTIPIIAFIINFVFG